METIFISIAAYRDPLCPITLISIYEMAKYPERIYIGLCQQNHLKDVDCYFPKNHPLYPLVKKNVRKISLPYNQAKGPTYARYICASLYKNEDYFMQIDSHSLFVNEWDELCIKMMSSIDPTMQKKIILSHYPAAIEDYTNDSSSMHHITTLIGTKFNSEGIPVFLGAQFKKISNLPTLNYYISANFIFSKGNLLTDVPFDPFLPFLFEGEEILYSIRAFTSGWDVYTPNINILFHHYTRKGEPKFWDDLLIKAKDSIIKTKFILGYPNIDINSIKDVNVRNSISIYGLGKKRKLSEFYKKTNILIYPFSQSTHFSFYLFIVILLILFFFIFFLFFYFKR